MKENFNSRVHILYFVVVNMNRTFLLLITRAYIYIWYQNWWEVTENVDLYTNRSLGNLLSRHRMVIMYIPLCSLVFRQNDLRFVVTMEQFTFVVHELIYCTYVITN